MNSFHFGNRDVERDIIWLYNFRRAKHMHEILLMHAGELSVSLAGKFPEKVPENLVEARSRYNCALEVCLSNSNWRALMSWCLQALLHLFFQAPLTSAKRSMSVITMPFKSLKLWFKKDMIIEQACEGNMASLLVFFPECSAYRILNYRYCLLGTTDHTEPCPRYACNLFDQMCWRKNECRLQQIEWGAKQL